MSTYTALITQHVGDIYVDDHTEGLTVFEGELYDSSSATDLGAHDGTAQVTWYERPGRDPVLTFLGRWTDHDGINHGLQLPIEHDVENVYDFGPFRARVTVS